MQKSVKKAQRQMGLASTGIATVSFQMNLKDWKAKREQYKRLISLEEIAIDYDANMLAGLAALLVEKGYLKSYHDYAIDSPIEKDNIKKAYYKFLKKNHISYRNTINKDILLLLYSMPSV